MKSKVNNYIFFEQEWKSIEDVETYPHFLRNVIIKDIDEFVYEVENASEQQAKDMVQSIYSGDAYILKNAFDAQFVEEVKNKINAWGLNKEDKYCEMRDGVESYRFLNRGTQKPEGGYTEVVHSSVFFRWDDPLDLFKHFDRYWRAFKIISGNPPDAFANNKPSDGLIDRITLMQYPLEHGKITRHYDSPRKQKLLYGSVFSQIGEDYDYGENGFYLVDKHGRQYFLENLAKKGDLICSYPAMYHGVPPVKDSSDVKQSFWPEQGGRFYLQCFSPESHEVKNRQYAEAIKDPAGHGPIANYIGGYDE